MEVAVEARRALLALKPDCVALELPQNFQDLFIQAAARLPDISLISSDEICFPCEPCDANFEGIRYALESHIPICCIDLDVKDYPEYREPLPDPYSISKIGLKTYYQIYTGSIRPYAPLRSHQDKRRELHMSRLLKELSFSYERIFVCLGMSHVQQVLFHLKDSSYPVYSHEARNTKQIATYTEELSREITAECGWFTRAFEEWRQNDSLPPPDRHRLIWQLLKAAQEQYEKKPRPLFRPQFIETTLRFATNWAKIKGGLLPSLFQLITSAKGCVDHNFAYEVWKAATEYPFYKNVDNLPVKETCLDEVWGASKRVHFHLKSPSEKGFFERRKKEEKQKMRLYPPSIFSMCSYQKEDVAIENFASHLKKKTKSFEREAGSKTLPFSTSLEDGIDVKETIRHWAEKKLYVKSQGRPPGGVGSCVVIFDEEPISQEAKEKYPLKMTWLGEHTQESDMAFYATSLRDDIIGPGISRCSYGGFLLSYPSMRLFDVWQDPEYGEIKQKHELLIAAACDYSTQPLIAYLGIHPPPSELKAYARRQAKRLAFLPLSLFPSYVIKKIRTFHILGSKATRDIAGEYID
jgi:hypothetical protein